MTDKYGHDEKEVQHAEVTVRVALPVDKEATDAQRKDAILRKLRLSDMADGLELRPGLRASRMDLKRTETMEEKAERLMGEAEARAEKKAQERYERHLDNRGRRP